jgi:hypothetical protein
MSPNQSGQRLSQFEQIKNPSKSPFTKGDFLFPPLKKGGRGDFLANARIQLSKVKLNLTLLCLTDETSTINFASKLT